MAPSADVPRVKCVRCNDTCTILACFVHPALAQCDQIGLFLKDLGNNFYDKSSPKIWHLRGHFFKDITFYIKTVASIFRAPFEKNWLFFISTSGHTGERNKKEITKRCRENRWMGGLMGWGERKWKQTFDSTKPLFDKKHLRWRTNKTNFWFLQNCI